MWKFFIIVTTRLDATMKRLPAPFPFFNQSKRPKPQASLAGSTSTRPSYFPTPHEENENRSSYIPNRKPATKQQHYSTISGYEQPLFNQHDHMSREAHHYQKKIHQPTSTSTPGNFQHDSWNSHQPLREISMQELPTTHPNRSAIKQAVQSTQSKPSAHLRNQTRVITTTSQGAQYWSQYKNHCHLLFEIYGFLDSQVSQRDFGCQQFMLKTVDGVIKCQFWEIDQKLNRMYRGKSYRVIGTWDSQTKALKCAKVRESTSQEQNCSDQFVKLSDRAMREFTCSISEP